MLNSRRVLTLCSCAAEPGTTVCLDVSHDDSSISVNVASSSARSSTLPALPTATHMQSPAALGQSVPDDAKEANASTGLDPALSSGQQVQSSPHHSNANAHVQPDCSKAVPCPPHQGSEAKHECEKEPCAAPRHVRPRLTEPDCSPNRQWQLQDDARLQQQTEALEHVLQQAAKRRPDTAPNELPDSAKQSSSEEDEELNKGSDEEEQSNTGLVCIACGASLQLMLAAAAHDSMDQIVCLLVGSCSLCMQYFHALCEVVLCWCAVQCGTVLCCILAPA